MGVASDVMPAEESSAVEMLDYFPTQKQVMDMWLDRIREIRTFNSSSDEDAAADVMEEPETEAADDPNAEGGEASITEEDSALASGMDELAGRGPGLPV